MERKLKDVVVKHPNHGETTVKAVHNNLDAITEAARRWGAQWSVIARESTFDEIERGAPREPSEAVGGQKDRTSPSESGGGHLGGTGSPQKSRARSAVHFPQKMSGSGGGAAR